MKSPAARTRTAEKLLHGTDMERQITLEEDAMREGVARYRKLVRQAINRGDGAGLKPAERLVIHWIGPMEEALKAEQKSIDAGEPEVGRAVYGPFIELLKPSLGAVLCVRIAVSSLMRDGEQKSVSLAYQLGRAWLAEINCELLRRKRVEYVNKKTGTIYRVSSADLLRTRIKRVTPGRVNWWAKKNLDDPAHSRRSTIHIGMRLLGLLSTCCTVPDEDGNEQKAFVHSLRRLGKHKLQGFVGMTLEAMQIIEEGHRARQAMRPRFLPMICKPMPWQLDEEQSPPQVIEGGYIQTRTPFISKPSRDQARALNLYDRRPMFEHINALAATPMAIDTQVLAVQQEFFDSGGGGPSLPHMRPLPKPRKPDGFDPDAPRGERWKNVRPDDHKSWRSQAIAAYKDEMEMMSQRESTIQVFQVARRFANETAFYFPKMIDFRSRVYSVPQPLNFEGNDLCRGLLRLARPKKPGPRGEYWLKIHAANMYGVDKVSFAERAKWTEQHFEDIKRSAEHPLDCEFWQHADGGDKAWQFLAACFALLDPEGAGAHIIRQVDGTFNGLQHYSALCRDENGAAACNLIDGPSPVDTYHVATERVAQKVARDMQLGVRAAGLVAPHITRKGCKPGAMTTVYGVTEYGRRNQCWDYLSQVGVPSDDRRAASEYMATAIKNAIADICPRAVATMQWLRDCAYLFAKSGRCFQYVTPLHFPMVQHYRNMRAQSIETCLQKVRIAIDDGTAPLDCEKQRDSAPPNFIHSLDATVMLMTGKACHDSGIDFVSVHDMFGTHAADADQLDEITRERFVATYRQPILENAYEQFKGCCPDLDMPAPPTKGTFDIDRTLDATYLFN